MANTAGESEGRVRSGSTVFVSEMAISKGRTTYVLHYTYNEPLASGARLPNPEFQQREPARGVLPKTPEVPTGGAKNAPMLLPQDDGCAEEENRVPARVEMAGAIGERRAKQAQGQ